MVGADLGWGGPWGWAMGGWLASPAPVRVGGGNMGAELARGKGFGQSGWGGPIRGRAGHPTLVWGRFAGHSPCHGDQSFWSLQCSICWFFIYRDDFFGAETEAEQRSRSCGKWEGGWQDVSGLGARHQRL